MTTDNNPAGARDMRSISLTDAIAAYHAGNEAYNQHPVTSTPDVTEEQFAAAIAATYGPPRTVLADWDQPAATFAEAVEALRLGRKCAGVFEFDDLVCGSMLDAALGFFDGATAEARLEIFAKGYIAAAQDIEPDATEAWIGRAASEDEANRFFVTVMRKAVRS